MGARAGDTMTLQQEPKKAIRMTFCSLEHTAPPRSRSAAIRSIADLREEYEWLGLDVYTFTDAAGVYTGFIVCKDGVKIASAEIVDP